MKFSDIVTLVVIAPETHADAVREALAAAGAGRMGDYTYCTFSTKGVGRFKPGPGAKPFIGKVGALEEVLEERIETVCAKELLPQVIAAIRKAHPYEEPSIDIIPRIFL